MALWSWLVSAILTPFFRSITDWLEAQQARADEVSLGQQTQAAADANAQTAQATADAKKVADVVQAENAALVRSAGDPSVLRAPDPDSRD